MEAVTEDSIVALSNGVQTSMRIPGRAKREAYYVLARRYGMASKRAHTRLFAGALVLLLRHRIAEVERVVVDREYHPGHLDAVKLHLSLKMPGADVARKVQFGAIADVRPRRPVEPTVFHRAPIAPDHGGEHTAHWLAYDTFVGRREPQFTASSDELIDACLYEAR